MNKANTPKLNRRHAYRISNSANLFFYKLDPAQISPAKMDTLLALPAYAQPIAPSLPSALAKPTSIDIRLPASETQENDTLNVNLSTSGVAFTSKVPLQAGDYLIARMQLLTGTASIMAACQVVFCKPSNPYENNRYPYLIGSRFVNISTDDQVLLERYIERRRIQQYAVNGLILLLALVCLAAPDVVLDILLALGHHLLETSLHLLHLLFEYLELGLDHVVEHTFHTGLHQTQIIVFYTLMSFGLAALYLLWRIVPPACMRQLNTFRTYCLRKKSSLLYYWGQQSLQTKIAIVTAGTISTACYVFFLL